MKTYGITMTTQSHHDAEKGTDKSKKFGSTTVVRLNDIYIISQAVIINCICCSKSRWELGAGWSRSNFKGAVRQPPPLVWPGCPERSGQRTKRRVRRHSYQVSQLYLNVGSEQCSAVTWCLEDGPHGWQNPRYTFDSCVVRNVGLEPRQIIILTKQMTCQIYQPWGVWHNPTKGLCTYQCFRL